MKELEILRKLLYYLKCDDDDDDGGDDNNNNNNNNNKFNCKWAVARWQWLQCMYMNMK